MTRIGRRLIEDFLLPALNEGKYGDLLKWVDKEKNYFSIRWSHKNAAKWTLADTAVFQDWDKLKGHYRPEIKGYYMQAKQRFRAALYKLSTVRRVPCEDKHVKKYQLVLNSDKKHHEIMPRKHHRTVYREENQKSIPTSVIRKNTSYVAKPSSFEESYSFSSSTDYCMKSDGCDETDEELTHEYRHALEQRKQSNDFYQPSVKTIKQEDNSVCPTVLRESSEMNSVRKPPHVPLQLVPVYSRLNRTGDKGGDNKRYESPHQFLVPTYNDTDVNLNSSPEKVTIPVLCNQEKVAVPMLCNMHAGRQNSDGALNLSVRCDESETLCR